MDKKAARWSMLGVTLLAILAAATIVGSIWIAGVTPTSRFDGKVLYISFHGGKTGMEECGLAIGQDNIIAYQEDGSEIGKVLEITDTSGNMSQIRGMLEVDGLLYVVNSYKDDSRILVFGPTNKEGQTAAARHKRQYLNELVNSTSTKDGEGHTGISHPYGIAADNAGHIFVSNQDSGVVTWYKRCGADGKGSDCGQPQPDLCTGSNYTAQHPQGIPGCFAYFPGKAKGHDSDTGVRSIVVDASTDLVYVARQGIKNADNSVADVNGVYVYDTKATSGCNDPQCTSKAELREKYIRVTGAIGLAMEANSSKLYIGANRAGRPDRCFEYDVQTSEFTKQFGSHWLDHPAGLVASGGILYVASQNKDTVIGFNIEGQASLGPLFGTCHYPEAMIAVEDSPHTTPK